MENEDLDRVAVAAGFDGGRSRIARCRADDRDLLTALGEHMIEQAADQLQRAILEGKRRPMEQFGQEQAVIELLERHDRRMPEALIGRLDHRLEIGIADGARDVGAHHLQRHIGIGQAAHRADVGFGEFWPSFGHVKSAVAGEAGEQYLFEG